MRKCSRISCSSSFGLPATFFPAAFLTARMFDCTSATHDVRGVIEGMLVVLGRRRKESARAASHPHDFAFDDDDVAVHVGLVRVLASVRDGYRDHSGFLSALDEATSPSRARPVRLRCRDPLSDVQGGEHENDLDREANFSTSHPGAAKRDFSVPMHYTSRLDRS